MDDESFSLTVEELESNFPTAKVDVPKQELLLLLSWLRRLFTYDLQGFAPDFLLNPIDTISAILESCG